MGTNHDQRVKEEINSMSSNHKVVMNIEEFVSTSLRGYFPNPTSYYDLVKVFGEPVQSYDTKVDVEWSGRIDDRAFTIYNWKNGKNYGFNCANEDITSWNIGAEHKNVADDLLEYFQAELKKRKQKETKLKYIVWQGIEFDNEEEALHAQSELVADGYSTKLERKRV
jgi:hypothetical protein